MAILRTKLDPGAQREPQAPGRAIWRWAYRHLPKASGGSYQIRKTWMNVVDKRAREFTACPQNLAPMVTQAMRSVAKTARRCWAIPNLRPECEATVLRIPTPVSGRGDMIVLLRPYGGHVACSAQEYGYTGQWEVLRESRRTPALQPPALSGRCCL